VTDRVLAAVEGDPLPAIPDRKRFRVAAALLAVAGTAVLFWALWQSIGPNGPPQATASRDRPEALPQHLLVSLAEGNEAWAIPELRAAVARAGDAVDAAQAAGYFALRGDDAGRLVLEHCLREGLELGAPTYFLAAAGLHRLGAESAWSQAIDSGVEAARKALADGNTEEARRIVVAAEYFARSLGGGEPVDVAGFLALEDRILAQRDEVLTSAAARRRLVALRR
ncbi:MAG: hypothetical protein ACYSUM_17560, partial [Planctomycetota bacterium]|jgi:hypothetical protein